MTVCRVLLPDARRPTAIGIGDQLRVANCSHLLVRSLPVGMEFLLDVDHQALGARIGVDQTARDDHRDYLAAWLRILRADPHHLWTVAGKAETAAAHLHTLAASGHEPPDNGRPVEDQPGAPPRPPQPVARKASRNAGG